MFPSTITYQAENLAQLALAAATQIDKFRRTKKANLEVIVEFANALANFSGVDDAAGGYMMLDPAATEMFNMATSQTIHKKITNTDLLKNELSSLIDSFRDQSILKEGNGIANLEAAKNFCLLIHQYILRHRPTSYPNEKGVFDYDYSYPG